MKNLGYILMYLLIATHGGNIFINWYKKKYYTDIYSYICSVVVSNTSNRFYAIDALVWWITKRFTVSSLSLRYSIDDTYWIRFIQKWYVYLFLLKISY